ncbi:MULTISPECIES: type II secretion system protein [Campylobacter]|uniref:Uncharacterized protein n=1 Tax=Campylobacter devanensis TaxID=3161138 RepID=A0A1X9STV2_9BACT|nr:MULTISPECIES: type II secretion system protein [Campylobacter]ARQ99558.1 hypothetical protein CIGN_1303 [Campylobacter lanienae]SUX02776.1 type II secretion system protein [Campylobacter lanienae]
MSVELVLTGLGYNVNDALVEQVKRVLSASDFDEKEIEHIINLHEKIKHSDGFVALSNSEDKFKIKCESTIPEIIDEFNEIVQSWASKYKIIIEKLAGKQTYYILRRED